MSDISFGSVYRIPITQAGVNSAKKTKLRNLIESYPNGLIGKSKTGQARISVPDSEDANFVGKLKAIGYKVFQKFEGDNISKENLDSFIKEKLDTRDFSQKGKQFKRMSKEMKEQRRFDRTYTPAFPAKISDEYDDMALKSELQLDKIAEKSSVKPDNSRVEEGVISNKKLFDTKKDSKVDDKTLSSSVEVEEVLESAPKSILKNDEIRQSAKYLEYKEKYGEEFAEAVFFGIK